MDPVADKLYWADASGLYRVNTSGTFQETISTSNDIRSVAVDHPNGKIYYTVTDGRIRRRNLDGTGIETVLTVAYTPVNIRIDGLGKMYWTSLSLNGDISRANTDGTQAQTIFDVPDDFVRLGFGLEVGNISCVRTDTYGDVAAPFNPPDPSVQPDATDISRTVDAFKGLVHGTAYNMGDVQPCTEIFGDTFCVGDGDVGFGDVSRVVDAFRQVIAPCF